MAEVKCNKCGASIEYEAGDRFIKCAYCETRLYMDKSGVGYFYIMPFSTNNTDAVSIFRAWAAGPEKVKDLDTLAQVIMVKQLYFPAYIFKRRIGNAEKIFMEPAKSTTLPGIHSLKAPAGDVMVFDQNYRTDVELIKPDIDMAAYLPHLPGMAEEQALTYYPLWIVLYRFGEDQFSAVIDGSMGEVFASGYPERKSNPYFIAMSVALALFFIEGWLTPISIGWDLAVALVSLPLMFLAATTIQGRL